MKKRDIKGILLILILVFLALLIMIGLRFTGLVIEEEKVIEVTRLVIKNETANLTEVKISIISTENVIAIQEKLSENCSVLSYFVEPEIEILAFKPSELTWILANRSDTIQVELNYFLDYECDVLNGTYYIINEENLEEFELEEESEEEQEQQDSGLGNIGNGGGSGGGSRSGVLELDEIKKAEDKEKFEDLKEKAEEAIRVISIQKETPGEIRKPSIILFFMLILSVLAIIIFFIISFLRRPKQ